MTLSADATLRHSVVEGQAASLFLRDGPVAAQLVLTSGRRPRLIVAFAAGNSGAGLWFASSVNDVHWRVVAPLQRLALLDHAGRTLHGIQAELEVDTDRLEIVQGLVGSVRVLRDHQFDRRLPALGGVAPALTADGLVAVWGRDRLDGAAGYQLDLQAFDAKLSRQGTDGVGIASAVKGQPLRLRLRVFTGDEPLKPLSAAHLLTPQAADMPHARIGLAFLAFEEKWLAGSWRFHTYFGRDTLMSLRLLLPVLQPAATESALASVIERLSPRGEVAHEEDIGEFPVLTRLNAATATNATTTATPAPTAPTGTATALPLAQPIFDYKMVDDDFMLLPVAAAYLLDTAPGRSRAAAFLARRSADGSSFGQRLARNAQAVLALAAPFAAAPRATNLVRLRAGETVGDWRDSADGLGGGVYAYSVNAVLVPAALAALQALHDSGLLDAWLTPSAQLADLARTAEVWSSQAPPLFAMTLSAAAAIARYAAEIGVPVVAVAADIHYSALALDEAGQGVAVMHSDFGFALLFGLPEPAVLARELATLLRPFPAGLCTDAGLVVANAVFADAALRRLFGADCYHGAVVWSWQQAMVAAGLARQLERSDLPPATHSALRQAQSQLWPLILATSAVAEGELWSWGHDGQRFRVEPFGPKCKTADESNALQLWSTVYLAVRPPADMDQQAAAGGPL